MEKLISKIIDMGMGQFMDNSRQELIVNDEIYLKDIEDEGELEEQYMSLRLPDKERILINDYIECVKTCDNRYSDISYMAGIKDTVRIFTYLGLLKDFDVSVKKEGANGKY